MIRALVHAYASGEIGLREFQDWLIPAAWDTQRFAPAIADSIHAVQLALAEHSSGDRTEPELIAELARIVGLRPELRVGATSSATSTASTVTVRIPQIPLVAA